MTKEEQLEKISSEIERISNKENKVMFFVPDTKGNPSGSLQFIYRFGLALKENGFNVEMLHQDSEFVGPQDWLGEEFSEIKHINVEKENVEVNPSDILIIPEIYSNLLAQVKELPCKKVMLFQNFDYLAEFMPISASLADLGIMDAITTSEEQKGLILSIFPYLNVRVLEPGISGMFRPSDEPQKLVVNIVSKDTFDVNKAIKSFYWKYPIYKWVSFRDLRGMKQEEFSKALRDGAITVWIDRDTRFGYSAIEALKSGSIVIGKIPSNRLSWAVDENGELTNDIIWFDDIFTLPDILASVVRSWTLDSIPEEIYKELDKYKEMFSLESFSKKAIDIIEADFMEKRKKDFEEVKAVVENNKEEKNEE